MNWRVSALAVAVTLIALPPLWATSAVRDELPQRLSDQEFWNAIVALSEPDGTFIADNLVSNELSFAQVVPELETLKPGGVYLGVGPEQNFTYVAAMRPGLAFVLDIRRDNLLLHLMYKALFEISADRPEFVARLFSRTRSGDVHTRSSAAEIMAPAMAAPPTDDATFRANARELRAALTTRHGARLSETDLRAIERIYETFLTYGPRIQYASNSARPAAGRATYATLMTQTDARGRSLSFLASEETYQRVRDLQSRNLIVPVVGNFAGPRAVRAIGEYVRKRSATVDVFYLSNVEEYLGKADGVPPNGDWTIFCRNVAALPVNERSVFVRPLGVAFFTPDGALEVSQRISFVSFNGDRYPAGNHPPLPPATSGIRAELAASTECSLK